MSNAACRLEDVKFERGKNYRLTLQKRSRVIDYVCTDSGFYEIRSASRGKESSDRPWITYSDMLGSMTSYAEFPKDGKGMTITRIDDGEVIFQGEAIERPQAQ